MDPATAPKVSRGAEFLEQALKFNPDDNYSPQAEALLEKAVKLDPTLVDAWIALGQTYFNKGDPTQALTAFEEAIKIVSPSFYVFTSNSRP
jgi:cytochrome c-type biogenesis protein CcmH/NrfG